MNIKELEKMARTINKRITKLEKENLTDSIDYRKLKEFAEKAGSTSRGYFKNRLATFEKKGGSLKEFERNLKLASQYGTSAKTKEMKEIAERIRKSGNIGDFVSEKTISDILEAQKWTKGLGSNWSRLKDLNFDSEQIVEIIQEFAEEEGMSLSKRIDYLENAYASKVIKKSIAIDFLKGHLNTKEFNEKIKRDS